MLASIATEYALTKVEKLSAFEREKVIARESAFVHQQSNISPDGYAPESADDSDTPITSPAEKSWVLSGCYASDIIPGTCRNGQPVTR